MTARRAAPKLPGATVNGRRSFSAGPAPKSASAPKGVTLKGKSGTLKLSAKGNIGSFHTGGQRRDQKGRYA